MQGSTVRSGSAQTRPCPTPSELCERFRMTRYQMQRSSSGSSSGGLQCCVQLIQEPTEFIAASRVRHEARLSYQRACRQRRCACLPRPVVHELLGTRVRETKGRGTLPWHTTRHSSAPANQRKTQPQDNPPDHLQQALHCCLALSLSRARTMHSYAR